VDAPFPLTNEELTFLRELVANDVPFLLVGMSAAALQGSSFVTEDIDLWFKDLSHPGLKRALDSVGGIYVPPSGSHPPALAGKGLNLFDIVLYLHGLEPFDEEMKHAVRVRILDVEVPVLSLSRIIASKKAANRRKDKLALAVLEDTLLASEDQAEGKPDCR